MKLSSAAHMNTDMKHGQLWYATRILSLLLWLPPCFAADISSGEHKLLYVAEPGIRDYLEYGGHGLLIFDIDRGHRFVRRIATGGCDEKNKPLNVKGICASAITKRLYITTTCTMLCLDLLTEKPLWEKSYEGGCDRLALSPDGKVIYVPSLEGEHWNVVDAISGEVREKIVRRSGAHNTIFGLDGARVYLAGLKSPTLTVMDARNSRGGPDCGAIRQCHSSIHSKRKPDSVFREC
jgi:hypothetical protein